jgi:ribose/xylose/arabinose/galactoside ABC-type transport system permease subunit
MKTSYSEQIKHQSPIVPLLDFVQKRKKYFSFLALILVMVIFSLLSPRFRTLTNMSNIAQQSAVLIIAGVGVTFVILTGSIDLSVGSILGLSAVFTAGATSVLGPYAILVGLLTGLVIGAINGLMFAKAKIPSFIVTLAMMTILRGVVLTYTNGRPVPVSDSFIINLSYQRIFSIPLIFILSLLTFALGYIMMEYTPFGRHIRAVGGEEKVARLSGINIDKVKLLAYVVSSILVGFAGVIQVSRIGAGVPTTGQGFEMDVISAIVLGGTTLSGGVGGVTGTVIGALTITALSSGLNIVGVSPYAQYIIKGLVLIVAILISIDRKKIGVIK